MKGKRSQTAPTLILSRLRYFVYGCRGDRCSVGAVSSGPKDKLGSELPDSQYKSHIREPWTIAPGVHSGRDGSVGAWPHLLVAFELENLKLQSGLCWSLARLESGLGI